MAGPQNRVSSYERQRGVDSDNVDIVGAVETSSIEDTAAGRGSRGVTIDTDKIISTDALEFEAFMRDELEVILGDAQSENEPSFIELNVNGDYRLAMRGDTVKLRRYHVAVLAQAKQSRVRQKKVVHPDGSMGFQEENVLSLTYPFQVSYDPNPKKGAPWLKQMLSNPA